MKSLRYLLAVSLCCGIVPGAAKADDLDYQAAVLDPPASAASNLTYVYANRPFDVVFDANCPVVAMGATGCFQALNNTLDTTFTSLILTFKNTVNPSNPSDYKTKLDGQPVSCDTSSSVSVFAAANCSYSSTDQLYTLNFSGGTGIRPGEFFVIAETGPDPDAFGTGTGLALASTATPEPGTLYLLASGGLFVALVTLHRRLAV